MVTGSVWDAVGSPRGFLCIGCLWHRLGRALKASDFTTAPVNDPDDPWNTDRLASRLQGANS